MNSGLRFLGSLALGAGLMYFFDPNKGRRRRAVMRDKALRTLHETEESLGKAVRDLGNRTSGFMSEAQHRLRTEVVSEDAMIARLRARLGHCVSHPRAIDVEFDRGHVTLEGDVLASELNSLLTGIGGVRGVHTVENRLNVHETADIPMLQGRARIEGGGRKLAPGPRLLTTLAGAALALYGARKRNTVGVTLGSVGLGLLKKGMNTDLLGSLGLRNGSASEQRSTARTDSR
jgi:hypothetical protein